MGRRRVLSFLAYLRLKRRGRVIPIRGVLIFASCLGIAAGLIWLILVTPEVLIDKRQLPLSPKELLDAESGIRSSMIQIVGGLALLTGLYFTARGLRLTREGHITDRYAKAIDQLGHENLDVRLGGIFALERLARDSATDSGVVLEVLTAFIREHTRESVSVPSKEVVTADVQAALKVIGRATNRNLDDRLDFYHCGLNDAQLSGDFSNSMFYYSRLFDTSFAGAKLSYAGLSFCSAERAAFSSADAGGADFVNATYVNSWFLNANLGGPTFTAVT
jgi:hypothetical protein